MGRQHRVTWRMGRRRTTAEEEGVVRLMGSAGGGRNPRDRMGGRGVRAWGGPRSGGQTHAEASVRRGQTQGTASGRRAVVRDCGEAEADAQLMTHQVFISLSYFLGVEIASSHAKLPCFFRRKK
jgi:hypothetical protein